MSDIVITRKSNDPLQFKLTLLDGNRNRQDLTGFQNLSFSMDRQSDGSTVIDHDEAGVTIEQVGPSTYGDLAYSGNGYSDGIYHGVVEAVVNGKRRSFPQKGKIVVVIESSPVQLP